MYQKSTYQLYLYLQNNCYDIKRNKKVYIVKILHFPTDLRVNNIIIICDFDVITSFGLLDWAEEVSKPSILFEESTFTKESFLV